MDWYNFGNFGLTGYNADDSFINQNISVSISYSVSNGTYCVMPGTTFGRMFGYYTLSDSKIDYKFSITNNKSVIIP